MKQIMLLIATTISALIFWLVTKPFIGQPFSFSGGTLAIEIWLWPLVFLVFFAGFEALSFLLLDSKKAWLVIALNLLVFALLFNPKEIIVWMGVLIALLFQFSALQEVKEENKNRLRLNVRSVIHSGMGRLVTSLLILISFAYFLNGGIREAAQKNELPGVVRQAVQLAVGSYVSENLETQNPSLRAQVTEKVLNQITIFLKPYFVFLPPVLAFGLFLILQGLSALFVWLAIIFSMLIFWILKMFKLIKIGTEQKEVETIFF